MPESTTDVGLARLPGAAWTLARSNCEAARRHSAALPLLFAVLTYPVHLAHVIVAADEGRLAVLPDRAVQVTSVGAPTARRTARTVALDAVLTLIPAVAVVVATATVLGGYALLAGALAAVASAVSTAALFGRRAFHAGPAATADRRTSSPEPAPIPDKPFAPDEPWPTLQPYKRSPEPIPVLRNGAPAVLSEHSPRVTMTEAQFLAMSPAERQTHIRPGFRVTGLTPGGLAAVDDTVRDVLRGHRVAPGLTTRPSRDLWNQTTPTGHIGPSNRRYLVVATPPEVHAQLERDVGRLLNPAEVVSALVAIDLRVGGRAERNTVYWGVVNYAGKHGVHRRLWRDARPDVLRQLVRMTERSAKTAQRVERRALRHVYRGGLPGSRR